MMTDEEILVRLLIKLSNRGCWHKGHLLEENLLSSVPKHEVGRAKDILDRAVKYGLIVMYGKTKYGLAYHLNIERRNEIFELIGKYKL